MKIEQFKEYVKTIIQNSNKPDETLDILNEMLDDNNTLEGKVLELTKKNEQLESDKITLTDYSRDLLVKMARSSTEDLGNKGNNESQEKEEHQDENDGKMTLEELFNEKGELK